MNTKNFKTEQEKKYTEKMRSIILQHCVACHQQLDLLQLRLVNFDDLITGVQNTIKMTTKQLSDMAVDNPPTPPFTPDGEPIKLKKV
jgi:mono/diheme cytochrome c family protein